MKKLLLATAVALSVGAAQAADFSLRVIGATSLPTGMVIGAVLERQV